MKKFFALVPLLILAASCAAPPTNREAEPGANTNLAETKSSAVTEADAVAQEKAAWDAIKNKDYEAFGNMLANDQLEVGQDGVYDKAGTMANVREFEPSEIAFTDWKYVPIDKDAFVVTYTANMKGKYKGKEFPRGSIRESSAWVNREGKWMAIYHQECSVATMPPPPPPASPSPAKTAATPASAPRPLTLGSDPVANEKAVWDAFKAKNYDAFASALAPDSVEVEPNGVFDKAGTVKGVKEFDASGAQLSDFKSLSLDSDAALVTYMVKLPGPDPAEQHSTIWVNRGGKWMALFHHGTPMAKASAMPAMKPSASPTSAASPKMKMKM